VLASIGVLACGGEGEFSVGFERTDSAGVEIVHNMGVASSAFQLDSGRVLPGPPLARVQAGRLLNGGQAVYSDGARNRLIFAHPDSSGWRSVGGPGEGPGEFRGIRAIWRCGGDTLVVRSGLSGAQLFTIEGQYARSIVDPRIRGGGLGVSSDCGRFALMSPMSASEQNLMADSLTYGWYDPAAGSLAASIRIPIARRQVISFYGEEVPAAVPFENDAILAVADSLMYSGSASIPAIRTFDPAGLLIRIARWQAHPQALTDDDRSRYERMRMELDTLQGPGASDRVPRLDAFELPKVKPLMSRLISGGGGDLWIQKYPSYWEGFESSHTAASDEVEWWVMDSSGKILGSVAAAPQTRILDVRSGSVLTVRPDRMGVPIVRVHADPFDSSAP